MSVFSERLIALRKERGFSQYEFAKVLKMSRSTISGYETEGKEPNYSTLRMFAEFFNVSADFLLGLSDERNHADVVFQKDSTNFKKHFDALPPAEKAIVAETFDSFYVMLFRDVCAADASRLSLYRDLLRSLCSSRSDIRKLVDSHEGSVTDAALLTPLLNLEGEAKKNIGDALDKLMQSDLDAALKKNGK